MKKYKLLSLFLALILSLSLTTPAFAGIIDDMEVAATAVLLADGDTGEVLYEVNAHEKRYPASITKVMTAMLVIEAIDEGRMDVNKVVTVSDTAMEGLSADGSNQNIKPGEQLTIKDLLYCALVASANEACNILAEEVAGTVTDFVALMNQEAARLGMEGTHFANPHGLHNDDHYTTAYDIWLMAREAMKHPTFREIVSTVDYYVPETNLHAQRHFYTTNALLTSWRYLGYTYRDAIGIKTGSTPEAGQCLVSAATKGDKTLYAVVLGAENIKDADGKIVDRQSFSESKRLLEWGFESFAPLTILTTTDLQGEVAVTLSQTEQVVAAPSGTLSATLPKDVTADDFTVTPTFFAESVEAPVKKGQVLGSVTVSYNGKEYGTLDLVALNAVERDEWMYRISRIKAFFGQLWVKVVIVVLAVLIIFLFIRGLFAGRRRSRYRSYSGGRSRYRGRR